MSKLETGVRGYTVWCQIHNYLEFMSICGQKLPEIFTLFYFENIITLPIFFIFFIILFISLYGITTLNGYLGNEEILLQSDWLPTMKADIAAFSHIFTHLRFSSCLRVLKKHSL